MKINSRGTVLTTIVGDFVDDGAERNPDCLALPTGENVRAIPIGTFVDDAARPPQHNLTLRNFVVLTSDNRSVSVRGHTLECGSDATRQVVVYDGDEKVCVALFDSSKILGIYEGAPPASA